MNNFGLGLVLSFTNNATSGINKAINSLNSLTQHAETASASLKTLADVTMLNNLAMVANQVGDTLYGMGTSVLGVFQRILDGTTKTGSEFENLRITVGALMNDTEKADKSINKLMDFAAKTPFEVKDLTGMFTTITANGLDAFETLTSAKSGFQQEMLGFIGDLMALRPDVPAIQWGTAIRNAFSGEVRSLKNALDVNVTEILGRKWGKTAEQVAQDFADLADNLGVAGLMMKNMGTWGQILANVSDQFERFYLAVADAGVFNKLKTALIGVTSAVFEMDKAEIDSIAKAFADGISFIVDPMIKLGETLGFLIRKFTEFTQTYPKLAKLIVQFTAIGAVFLATAGFALKLTASLANVLILMKMYGVTFSGITKMFVSGIKVLTVRLLTLTALIGTMYLAWKYDFAGIRTLMTNFVKNVKWSFDSARRAINGTVLDMRSTIKGLDRNDFFDNLTFGLIKLMLVFRALGEAWDDYTLSADTFEKLDELGLLPLIERFLDLKYRFGLFKDGFIAGLREASDAVGDFIAGLKTNTKGTFIETALTDLEKFLTLLSNNDSDAWYKFGNSFSKFAVGATIFFGAFKILKPIISTLINVIKFMSSLSGVAKAVGGIIKGVFSIFRPIVTLFSGLGETIGTVFNVVKTLFTSLGTFGEFIGTAFGALKGGIVGILTAIGTVVTAVLGFFGIVVTLPAWLVGVITVAVVAVLALIIKYREQIWNAIKQLGNWIKEFFSSIWNSDLFADARRVLEPFVNTVKNVFGVVKDTIKNMIDTTVSFFTDKWNKIVDTFELVKERLIGFGNEIKDGFKSIFDKIKEYADPIIQNFNDLKDTFGEFFTFAKGKADEFITFISPALNTIAQLATESFNTIKETFITIWRTIWAFIGPVVTTIATIIGNGFSFAYETVANLLTLLFDIVRTVFVSIFSTVMNILSSLWQGIVGIVKGIIDVVGGILNGVFGFISNIAMSIMDLLMGNTEGAIQHLFTAFAHIQKMFYDVWNGIVGIVGSALEAVANVILSVLNGIKDVIVGILGNIGDYFKTQFSTFVTTAKDNLNAIKTMFSDIFNNVKNVVREALEYISNKFKGLNLQLPKIKLPHFKLTGGFSIMPPSTPKVAVDWYAKGGVFNQPSVIGVGEEGQEAVMPLERNTGWIGVLASKIGNLINNTRTNDNNMIVVGALNAFTTSLSSVVSAVNGLIPVMSVNEEESNGTEFRPINNTPTNNSYAQTYYNNNTNNNNQQEISRSVDNSVHISEGAIQITAQNSSPQEMRAMADYIMNYIQRQQELKNIANYRDPRTV